MRTSASNTMCQYQPYGAQVLEDILVVRFVPLAAGICGKSKKLERFNLSNDCAPSFEIAVNIQVNVRKV
jgi:hypothetical protein